ncbi:dnaJ homolog subfamily C member 8-like [Dendronephthya gigantea]|uniref:dnaJ homolog subfamily C member 8-like n=1 Tax=Dendronephthya gigantea TaxID=151771 RepID=UPI00106AA48B|nr:dnaJ homolog subfamily C member 8-like [Dendronephthya gigantea]
MAGSSSENQEDGRFENFLQEVKTIEQRDSVLTSKQQIDRLLKPGSTYLNLNPFEVLMLPPEATSEQIKKQYRRLSILIHPDKNADDRDRAQNAFDELNKAYKLVNDEKEIVKVKEMINEGKALAEQKLSEKRKLAKKEGKTTIEEDDSEMFAKFVRTTTIKLFADYELRRKHLEQRDAVERKRQREQEIQQEEKAKKKKEWDKKWEDSRQERVNSWRDFKQGKKKSKKTAGKLLKPPRLNPEKRT